MDQGIFISETDSTKENENPPPQTLHNMNGLKEMLFGTVILKHSGVCLDGSCRIDFARILCTELQVMISFSSAGSFTIITVTFAIYKGIFRDSF